MNKKTLPRHAGGTFELKEGTGPITGMISFGEFLEIYKEDKTFRVQSPENIDPKQTNPNALWVTTPVSNVGSKNPIISRLLLQNHEILKAAWFQHKIDNEQVIQLLHSCKENLLACDDISKDIELKVDEIISKLQADGIPVERNARGLSSFPHVIGLETDCDTFLIKAKRAIRTICALAKSFLRLTKDDNNFDDLLLTITPHLEHDAPLLNFVKVNKSNIKQIIELRNFLEHPGKDKKTVIENFHLTPDMKIITPQWYVTGNETNPIKEEMKDIVNYLLEITESMFLHLVMATVKKDLPYIIVSIDDDKINKNAPVKYRLTFDLSKMNFPK